MIEIEYSDHEDKDQKFVTTERMAGFLQPILEGKVYPKLNVPEPRAILDVGANHGAATVFFHEAWPEATIYSFEPASEAFELLKQNTSHMPFGRIFLANAGILSRESNQPLYAGTYNEGEASIFDPGHGRSEDAQFLPIQRFLNPTQREQIDIVKIDVEGAECEVLSNLLANGIDPMVIYVEYQSQVNRQLIDSYLIPTHYLMVNKVLSPETGEMIYVRKS